MKNSVALSLPSGSCSKTQPIFPLNMSLIKRRCLSSVEKNGVNIITSAAWTHVYNDEEMILLGNVEIDKLLLVMKKQLPFVSNKTKEIFDKGMGGTL